MVDQSGTDPVENVMTEPNLRINRLLAGRKNQPAANEVRTIEYMMAHIDPHRS